MSQNSPQPLVVRNIEGIAIVNFINPKIGIDDRSALYELVEKHGYRRVVLNFENVRFLSSAPIGVLINLKKKAEAVGGSVGFCRLDPDVREILRLTAVDGLF